MSEKFDHVFEQDWIVRLMIHLSEVWLLLSDMSGFFDFICGLCDKAFAFGRVLLSSIPF